MSHETHKDIKPPFLVFECLEVINRYPIIATMEFNGELYGYSISEEFGTKIMFWYKLSEKYDESKQHDYDFERLDELGLIKNLYRPIHNFQKSEIPS
ncbi:hypothetical protein [Aquamicrobium sp.]|uniref:hypothetical protein n=1 Tax=Aquamicrobium sp. TaxID=1872579 RepID=UPI00258B65C2|nr:hypothetical protein [Aquamicrobium sp.]MCK9549483.1 hypothetical protein [Aquamicrobium sp.]